MLTAKELARLERENLRRALEATGWQIAGESGAARLLGRGSLHARLAGEGAPASPESLSGGAGSARELAKVTSSREPRRPARCLVPGTSAGPTGWHVHCSSVTRAPAFRRAPEHRGMHMRPKRTPPSIRPPITATPGASRTRAGSAGTSTGTCSADASSTSPATSCPTGCRWSAGCQFLGPGDRRLLSQIQGRTYANVFGLVERFINAKVLELSRDHWLGDQTALEALVGFSQEELKHQEMFRRIERMIAAADAGGLHLPAQAGRGGLGRPRQVDLGRARPDLPHRALRPGALPGVHPARLRRCRRSSRTSSSSTGRTSRSTSSSTSWSGRASTGISPRRSATGRSTTSSPWSARWTAFSRRSPRRTSAYFRAIAEGRFDARSR